MGFFDEGSVGFGDDVKVVSGEFVDVVEHFHARSGSCVVGGGVLEFGEIQVEVFSEDEEDENELNDNIFINLIHEQGDKSTHNGVNSYGLDSVVEDFLDLDLFL